MKKALKIFAVAFVATTMFALTGCKKENSDLIIGKWNFDKVTAVATLPDGSTQDVSQWLSEEIRGTSMEFKSDGTVVSTYSNGETESDKYTIDGDKLTVDGQTMTIKTLDKKELVLGTTENESGMKVEVTMYFKKA